MEIVQFPNEILVKKCGEYDYLKMAEDVQSCVEIQKLMEPKSFCLGIAAPQVGIARRFFVMREGLTRFIYCFDPVIISHGRDVAVASEGCMSIGWGDRSLGGVFVKAPRWRIVTLRFTDIEGKRVERTFKGMDARVVQHEIDHLNGLLIVRTEADDADKR